MPIVDRSLKPCIGLIKKVIKNDGRTRSNEKVNDDLFRTLTRCSRIVHVKSRLEANIQYLEICGVVGSQLSALLLKQPRIFSLGKEKLAELVSRALDMDFTMGSRMLAYAIHSLSCMSINTLNGKYEVFRMFVFSMDELALMFRKSPHAFGLSEAKLRWKIEFFLNNLKINKLVLVPHPTLLTCSIEDRVIPRYTVLEMLKSRRLFGKDLNLYSAMCISNRKFLEKYILRFKNDAEDLLLAYNAQLPDNSEK
ncbi:hypothetical protein Pfo_007760 [Paulownia fortunei]|nr:hypothetical protein Pfo_007760 [Paulownia fortunei]